MATENKPPSNFKPWKPGESGNPLGGQLHDKEFKAAKMLTKKELARVATFIIDADYEDLKYMLQFKKTRAGEKLSVLQCMVISVTSKIIAKGDAHGLDIFLNRLIGKVKDEIEHSGMSAPQVIVRLPSNGMEIQLQPTESK